MKDLDWIKTAIIFSSIVIAGYLIGNMHKTGKKYDRYVQVKGLSEREVKADLAVWPINITLAGNDLEVLKRDIEKQIAEVYDFFIDQGFDKDDLTKGSTNINDIRANIYNQNYQNAEFRYIAISELTVRTNDIERLQIRIF